jgi:hypothetical protein
MSDDDDSGLAGHLATMRPLACGTSPMASRHRHLASLGGYLLEFRQHGGAWPSRSTPFPRSSGRSPATCPTTSPSGHAQAPGR